MKKMMSVFFLLLSTGVTTVFASEDPEPSQVVLDGFKKEFSIQFSFRTFLRWTLEKIRNEIIQKIP